MLPCWTGPANLFDGNHTPLLLALLCAALAAVDVGAIVYSTASFRTKQLHAPANFSYHRLTEILWALIPVMILVGSVMPALTALAGSGNVCQP